MNIFLNKNDEVEGNQVLCFECHEGHMTKIIYPHSFDFNLDGWVPRTCDQCGTCNDQELIIIDHGIIKKPLTNKFIKKILNQVIATNRMEYKLFKELLRFFKSKQLYHLYDFASLIYQEMTIRGYEISFDFIIKTIYQKYDPLIDFT